MFQCAAVAAITPISHRHWEAKVALTSITVTDRLYTFLFSTGRYFLCCFCELAKMYSKEDANSNGLRFSFQLVFVSNFS